MGAGVGTHLPSNYLRTHAPTHHDLDRDLNLGELEPLRLPETRDSQPHPPSHPIPFLGIFCL